MEYRTCGWNISCDDVGIVRNCRNSTCESGCFCSNGYVLEDGVCVNPDSCPRKWLFINFDLATLLHLRESVKLHYRLWKMSQKKIISISFLTWINLITVSSPDLTWYQLWRGTISRPELCLDLVTGTWYQFWSKLCLDQNCWSRIQWYW